MAITEKPDKIKTHKMALKEMFRDHCGNLVCIYGHYGIGWKVQRISPDRTFVYYFKKRVEANRLISKLRKKKM